MAGQLSMFPDTHMAEVMRLVDAGALFAVSHSGGKDSQAMTIRLRALVPDDQLVIVHAPLGRVEWPGTIRHIRETTPGLPLVLAPLASGKDLLERVEERGMWPSPAQRWCTSDLKRGPIERELRRYLARHPRYGNKIVQCMGMRAEESPGRAKAAVWRYSGRNSKAGRSWYDWLPIHGMAEREVYAAIRDAGERWHWAYDEGMSRLSCSFCIMANRSDLRTAARLRPGLFAEYVQLEERIGHTFSPSLAPLSVICNGGGKA